jgi:hypothetical protein
MKAFDPSTGEVMYNDVCIEQDTWRNAIPTILDFFHQHMKVVFPDQSDQIILQQVLNTKNRMHLRGNNATVTVKDKGGKVVNTINIVKDLIPKLANNSKIQGIIEDFFSWEKGTLLYLSSGAGRGTEINQLNSFGKAFKLQFNHLHFQMKSAKGAAHGVDPNKWVDHYVPQSLTRILVVLNLCIYPAAKQNNLKIPTQDASRKAANAMFQKVFNVSVTSTGDCRHFMIQIANYLAPRSLAPTTTYNEVAKQFHHTPAMHHKHYSSQTYQRTPDGGIMMSPIEVARKIHEALGEAPNI